MAFLLRSAPVLFISMVFSCSVFALAPLEGVNEQNIMIKNEQALSVLERLLYCYPHLLVSVEDPSEIYYLHGFIAYQIAKEQDGLFWDQAVDSLNHSINQFPQGKFADASLNLLGIIYYSQQQYGKAEEIFLRLVKNYPRSPKSEEALFWASRCADCQHELVRSREYRYQLLHQYPNSPLAAEAYFTCYSYQEYLQGDRAAISHLEGFASRYPKTHFLIHSWYLIGLDNLRDRKTPEGKWIRKRNLTRAIEAFHETERLFDLLYQEKAIPNQTLDQLITIRYRAIAERALANQTIADESEGPKRQIYLEYAINLYTQTLKDFDDRLHPYFSHLKQVSACERIQEEMSYQLGQVYLKANQELLAKKKSS